MRLFRFWTFALALASIGQTKPGRVADWREEIDMAITARSGAGIDWDAAGSWTNGVPGAGGPGVDTALLDASSTGTITTDIDRQTIGAGTEVLHKLISTPDHVTGDLGAAGNYFIEEFDGSSGAGGGITWRSSTRLYFKEQSGGVTQVVLDSTNIVDALTLGNAIDRLFIKSGHADSGTFSVTRLTLDGINASYAGAGCDSLDMVDGRCVLSSAPGVVVISGGYLEINGAFVAGTVIHQVGGYIKYQPGDALASTSAELFIHGGTFDCSAARQGLAVNKYEIGPRARIIGAIASSVLSGASYSTDLRENYP